jgi:hypothetical protein
MLCDTAEIKSISRSRRDEGGGQTEEREVGERFLPDILGLKRTLRQVTIRNII